MVTFETQRQLHASPAAVFAAIQNPERLARWWGPAGFSNEIDEIDFAEGGRWVYTMIGPDGTRWANESVFRQIDRDRRVVIEHTATPHFTLSITLDAANGGTRVTWRQSFVDPAVAEALRPIVEPANEQNLDRLDAEVGRG
ncbi:SRPBCC domain-containing protein [Silvimonas sp. JCM 19000]